jgi:hypothetical protein
VENSDNSELRRTSCFPSHSGHRTVVHRARSEARLTSGRLSRPKVAGASFLQQGYDSDRTHCLHSCHRDHNRAVTSLWLANLHDGKRGACQVSQGASYLGRHQPLLDVRGSARAFTTTRTRARAGAFPTTRIRGSARAYPTTSTHGRAGAFLPTRTR